MLQGFKFKASLLYGLHDFVLKEDETPSSLHFKDSHNDDATAVLTCSVRISCAVF